MQNAQSDGARQSWLHRLLVAWPYWLTFIFMFGWNYITPYFDDDLYYLKETPQLIFSQGVHDYFYWNGRFVGQSIMRSLTSGNRILVSLLNALVFTLLLALILTFARSRTDQHTTVYKTVIVILFAFVFLPAFGQTVLWRSGSGNYLWTTVINLSLLWVYIKTDFLTTKKNAAGWVGVPFFLLLAFIAGWSNENTSGGTFIVLLCYTGYRLVQKHHVSLLHYLGMGVFLVGYAFLLLAPGNKIRTQQTATAAYKQVGFIHHFLTGFTAVNASLLQPLYIIFIVLIVAAFVLTFYFKRDGFLMFKAGVWTLAGILTIYVLSFSPTGQDGGRAYFGGIVFMIIGFATLLPNHFAQLDQFPGFFFQTFAILLFILGGLQVATGFVDAYKAGAALKTRYAYVQSHQTKKVLKVAPLYYWPQTKYALNDNLQEIGTDPTAFPNDGYKDAFGSQVVIDPSK